MLILGFVQWWYSQGWLELVKRVRTRIAEVFRAFSVGQILRTLFSPWKQIVAGKDPNATIGDRTRGILDNLVSRTVGFFVRIFTLVAAFMVAILTLVVGLVMVVLWPLLPPFSIWLVVKAAGVI